MFQVDEMIVYGKHGVCKIAAKGKLDMSMIDPNKEYYTLIPCKEKASVIYAPVVLQLPSGTRTFSISQAMTPQSSSATLSAEKNV